MDNFNLRTFLAEGKLHEVMFDVATTAKVAQKIADAFTAEDSELDLKYVVNPDIEASSFDLDVEAGPNTPGKDWKDKNGFSIDNYLGKFAGGSFYIKDGVVYNAASRNAPVANVSPEGEVEMISAADSRAAIGMDDEIDMDRYNDELNPGMYIDDEEWEREMGRMEENKEETKSNKMKKSELKEMIKSAFLNETSIKETLSDTAFDMMQDVVDALGAEKAIEELVRAMSDDDALSYLEYIIRVNDINSDKEVDDIPGFEGTKDALDSLSIREEEEEDVEVEDKEEIDIDTDAETADAGEVDVEADAEVEMTGDTKEVQDNLQAALEAAKALGDQKLVDQIGNSITFFTRTHVVGKKDVAEGDIDVEVDSPVEDAKVGMDLEEALNKPIAQIGPDIEKRMKTMGFDTKVFANPSWGVPSEAKDAIEANPKLAAISFDNRSGMELMRIITNASRKKDLQKVRDYFQVPEQPFGPEKEISWIKKQMIQNINPGDWTASQIKQWGDSRSDKGLAYIDWYRMGNKKLAPKTTDALGRPMAAESLNEEISRMQKLAGIKK